jgi:nitrogen fixation NifU-like protein
MSQSFDDFADRLQEQINEEVVERYGDKVFQRWRKPRLAGRMENPTGFGSVKGAKGDTIEVFLRMEAGVVKDASFTTTGCGCSVASGHVACELALGKKPEELASVTGDLILDILEGLPDHDVVCAFQAAKALRRALKDCETSEQ